MIYFRIKNLSLDERFDLCGFVESLGVKCKFYLSNIGIDEAIGNKLILIKLKFGDCLEPVDENGKRLWDDAV